jgi:hypothetical protein
MIAMSNPGVPPGITMMNVGANGSSSTLDGNLFQLVN